MIQDRDLLRARPFHLTKITFHFIQHPFYLHAGSALRRRVEKGAAGRLGFSDHPVSVRIPCEGKCRQCKRNDLATEMTAAWHCRRNTAQDRRKGSRSRPAQADATCRSRGNRILPARPQVRANGYNGRRQRPANRMRLNGQLHRPRSEYGNQPAGRVFFQRLQSASIVCGCCAAGSKDCVQVRPTDAYSCSSATVNRSRSIRGCSVRELDQPASPR